MKPSCSFSRYAHFHGGSQWLASNVLICKVASSKPTKLPKVKDGKRNIRTDSLSTTKDIASHPCASYQWWGHGMITLAGERLWMEISAWKPRSLHHFWEEIRTMHGDVGHQYYHWSWSLLLASSKLLLRYIRIMHLCVWWSLKRGEMELVRASMDHGPTHASFFCLN
jgi:hypothetical protein